MGPDPAGGSQRTTRVPLPGAVWSETNVVRAGTEQGASGAYTLTVEVLPGQHFVYLPLAVRDF